MSVNIGHGDRRVIDAMHEQATKLQFVQPAFATEIRARLGAKLAEILPGDMNKVFFTLGGAEAIENAIKLARHYTGRYKVLARYRAYHGATYGAMTLTGDPRRWANEPGLVGVVRYPDTHRWGEAEPRPVEESLQGLEDVIRYEGASTIAAVFLETIVGTNGILIPPDGYIRGVRELCDRNGILMVCDEVMAGFGRTGRWFAVDHWDVVPDLMTMAKGLTSSYLPLGAVAMRDHDRRGHGEQDVLRRPHVQQPPGQPGRGARDDRRLRGGRPHRQRRAPRRRDARPPRGPRGQAPVRRRAPQPRAVRDPRARPVARPVDADDRVQRDERRDEGDRQVLPRQRPVHDARQQRDPHEPAAVHHGRAAGRRLRRSSTAPSTSPTRPSPPDRELRQRGGTGARERPGSGQHRRPGTRPRAGARGRPAAPGRARRSGGRSRS